MSNFKPPVNNILDDLDALKGVEFESVIDRYYTRLYKPLNAKIISEHISGGLSKISDTSENMDQYYFFHSNHLILFGISAKHDLFTKIKAGVLDPTKCSINYSKAGGKVDRTE